MQEWARDPKARAKGYLRFDKVHDRFDASAAARLYDLRAAPADWVEPPGPPRVAEKLLANLMPIAWRTDHLLSVSVPSGSPKGVLGPAWEKGYNHPAGALKRQRYWSFAAFDERFLSAISGSDLAQHPLEDFLDRDRLDEVNILKELVVRAVVARHEELRWHAFKKLAYSRHREPEEDVEFAWTKGKPRAVVQARFSTDEDWHFTGYRHDAAELSIRDLDDQWAIQINPTYLLTKVNFDHARPTKQASEGLGAGLAIPFSGEALAACLPRASRIGRMPSGYGKDLADSAQAHTARTHQRCERCDRKPPDAVVVVHHRDERGVAGRRALDKTILRALSRLSLARARTPATGAPDGARSIRPSSARCRGCH